MFYSLDDLKNVEKNIPQLKNVYIDVGAAAGMFHGATWLLQDDNAFVIGIEPNTEALTILEKGRRTPARFPHLKLDDCSIWDKNKEVKRYNSEQVCVIQCAIDDVAHRTKANFFCTDKRNIGCSSLLKPTPSLGLDVTDINMVDVCSLEDILDSLNMQDLTEIAFVKTDTQGKDFDVVTSLGKYLHRVLALKCEHNVKDFYENSNSKEEFLMFMKQNNFIPVYDTGYDIIFINGRNYRFVTAEKFSDAAVELLFEAHSPRQLDQLLSILRNLPL
jgi:FkbM family methyltransferase